MSVFFSRDASAFDVLANTIGAILGTLLCFKCTNMLNDGDVRPLVEKFLPLKGASVWRLEKRERPRFCVALRERAQDRMRCRSYLPIDC